MLLASMSRAVRRAARLASRLQGHVTAAAKTDASPVTVADWASQALIARSLRADLDALRAAASAAALSADADADADNLGALDAFRMLGEEDATLLTGGAAAERLLDAVVAALNDETPPAPTDGVVPPSPAWTAASVVEALQFGRSSGGAAHAHFLCDPIDGTKGFLRGSEGQFAVGLALMRGGRPVLAAIACPNLPQGAWGGAFDAAAAAAASASGAPRGCLFLARAGGGATVEPLFPTSAAAPQRLRASSAEDPSAIVRCESYEAAHSDRGIASRICARLSLPSDEGGVVRIDSMAKYGLLARGDAHLLLRLPSSARLECAWDHAMGVLLLEEAGGVVTDAKGAPLDFTAGASLWRNYGVLAASSRALHARSVAAARAEIAEAQSSGASAGGAS